MCCNIDLNSQKDARHFLGKDEPNLLPKTHDNVSTINYANTPAVSLFDRLVAHFKHKTQPQGTPQ